MKRFVPVIVILLMVSTSFVGMSNNIEKSIFVHEKTNENYPISIHDELFYKSIYSTDKQTLRRNIDFQDNPNNDIWNKTYGGDKTDKADFVQQTTDGGYILVCSTTSYGAGEWDVWLVKTDENGSMVWNKTFGGPYEDVPACVRQTNDGGFIIAGYCSSDRDGSFDTWLIKTDENGSKIWDRKYKGPYPETFGECVIELVDGYLVMSNTWDFLTPYIWLVKTDLEGKEVWNKTFGFGFGDLLPDIIRSRIQPHCFGTSIIQTSDNGFVIVGRVSYFIRGTRVLLIKIDIDGNRLWRKTYTRWTKGFGVFETEDGGFIISAGQAGNIYIIRTNENGKKLWSKSYLGVYWCSSFAQTSDGGYVIAGTNSENAFDAFLIKINKNGNKLWEMRIGGRNRDCANCVIESNDCNYIIAGETSSFGAGGIDAWLIKISDIENQRPEKPSRPIGPTKIKYNVWYNYTTNTTDPDGNLLYYKWNWDRFRISNWIGPYNCSENCTVKNSWYEIGLYFNVKVRAMDEYGGVSDWSDPLTVCMSLSKSFNFYLDQLNKFPLLQRLLEVLII